MSNANLPEPPDPIELTSHEISGRHPYREATTPKYTGFVTPSRVRVDDDNNLDFWLEVELTERHRLLILKDIIEEFHTECLGEKMLLPNIVHFQEQKAKEEANAST